MTKTSSMVSHKNYNLSANEDFVKKITFKLITCFIDGFTLKVKSQSITSLLNESEHISIIFWTLKMKCIQYEICEKNDLEKCMGNGFFKDGRDGHKVLVGSGKSRFLCWAAAPACVYLPRKDVFCPKQSL